MESRCKSSFEEMFPHGQELIHLVPSEGAKPPRRSLLMSQNDTPPPPVSPKIIPVIEPLTNLLLPEGYSLAQKWNYMNHPDKPDHTATKIATLGLELEWIQKGRGPVPPPLTIWKEGTKVFPERIPSHLKTSEKQTPLLKPFLVIGKRDDIATCDIHEIPDAVHVSCQN